MNSLVWYRLPTSQWQQGLPVGNGMLAAMVIDEEKRQRLALNHEWLWRAKGRDRTIEPRHERLSDIRELFFQGKLLQAGTLANEILGGPGGISRVPNRVDPYQPAGDLFLEFDHAEASDFRRELDLDPALVSVSYQANGATVRREVIAHSARPVLAARVSTTHADGLKMTVSLSRTEDPECTLEPWSGDGALGFTGEFIEGVCFALEARIITTGGSTISDDPRVARLRIENCREVLMLLTIATNVEGGDPASLCRRQLQGMPNDWDELLKEHVAHHRKFYGRVSLELGEDRDDTPTDERLAALRAGGEDDGVLALYFNFGRYLLVSSSRPGGLPANLQGKWNEDLDPPWQSDLHHDVNLEMNYWAAEACNLAECIEPLFDHVERFLPHGREVARLLYDCDGVFLPIQTDPWGRATPESRGWDVWTGAAAWLAQHFWWRYEYGRDETFLRERAYPLFKEVAAFYESFLVRDPQGRLVTAPSQSPENCFVGGTWPVSLCVAATMDLELIHDALSHAIQASEILGVDEDMRQMWRQILADIPPLQIGRHGQLQEWLEDYEECEPEHRHISHLLALYPGDQITLERTPELARAARVSLERRLAAGGGQTGWGRAWVACCCARLREGDNARQHLRNLVAASSAGSLLGWYPPGIFQIDANFGGTAGLVEMLLQSHHEVIRILPALPSAWPEGRVSGLRARAGFELDIAWAEGRAREVTLHSHLGGVCRIQLSEAASATVNHQGREVPVTRIEPDMIEFDTEAGAVYRIHPQRKGA